MGASKALGDYMSMELGLADCSLDDCWSVITLFRPHDLRVVAMEIKKGKPDVVDELKSS